MQDAKGRELRKGDLVMVPMRVEILMEKRFLETGQVSQHIGVCSIVGGYEIMVPPETMIRANAGDETDFTLHELAGHTFIR